jgi:HK97 family phage portal protein
VNLVESIFRGGLGLRADAGGAPAPWDDYWYEPSGGQTSSAGMRVSPETAKRLGTVIACVSVRAKAIATLPCKIHTDLAGGGSKVVPNHPLYDVLYDRPNDIQTAFDFKYMMQAHVDLRGNAYALKIPGPRGPVDQLKPLHPDRVQVEILRDTGRLIYVYNDPLTNKTERYTQDEIFHLRDWSDNSAVGQSRISMGMDLLGVALARQDYIARFLKNDTQTGSAIVGTNFKNKEDEEEFRKNFQKAQSGANRGKVLMLALGLDIKSLGVKPIDAQLIEGAKVSDTQICSLMGVFPHIVGVDSGKAATYASTEQFNIMHAQQCVHPMIVMWEQAIQRDLIASGKYYAKFSMASLLRGDNATRFAGYAVAIQNSWMCPDDVRALEELNPIPNGEGKVFWRSANLLPLAQLEAPSQASGKGNGQADDQEGSADDAANDGAGGDADSKAQASAAMQGRLELLATGAADRCVRKEVSAVRKMIERKAGIYEVTEFYREHARFIAEVFHMEAAAALTVMIACDARAQELSLLLGDEDDEFQAGAQVWVENLAATLPKKLVALAVEGVR